VSLTIPQTDKETASDKGPDLLGSLLIAPFTTPRQWAMIDGLKFTHPRNLDPELAPYLVRPIVVTKSDVRVPIVDKDPLRVASRGISLVNVSATTRSLRIEEGLRDFGIEINQGAPTIKLLKRLLSEK
jgi:hypothetical protein